MGIDVKDDVLTISAERGDKKYRKEVLLPRSVSKEKRTVKRAMRKLSEEPAHAT